MSIKYDLFIADLKQLMDKHDIVLHTTLYDSIHVHRIDTTYQSKEDVIDYSIENFIDEMDNEY